MAIREIVDGRGRRFSILDDDQGVEIELCFGDKWAAESRAKELGVSRKEVDGSFIAHKVTAREEDAASCGVPQRKILRERGEGVFEPLTSVEAPAPPVSATNPTNLPVDDFGNVLDGEELKDVEPKTAVILNEQHSLLPAQTALLDAKFGAGGWKIFPVPATGWTRQEIETLAVELAEPARALAVVFASPIPLLIARLAARKDLVLVFHNDRRVAKEVPDGKGGVKVIHTVAPDGWELA